MSPATPASPQPPQPDLTVRLLGPEVHEDPGGQAAKERSDRDSQAELDRFRDFGQGVLDVGKGSLERSRAAAELIQKSAAAVAVLYSGVLGLVFSVGEQTLPLRGVLPVAFLGVAMALATIFIALLADPEGVEPPAPTSSPREATWSNLLYFVRWARGPADLHRHLLVAAAVAIGSAVLLLAAPFVTFEQASPSPEASSTNTTAGETLADWPQPITSIRPIELRAIAYQAQIDEAVQQRATAADVTAEDELEWVWFVGAGALLLVVAGIALRPYVARDC